MGLLYGRRRGSSRVWLDLPRIVSYNILAWISRLGAALIVPKKAGHPKAVSSGVVQLVARGLGRAAVRSMTRKAQPPEALAAWALDEFDRRVNVASLTRLTSPMTTDRENL